MNTFKVSPTGDFDAHDMLELADADLLIARFLPENSGSFSWLENVFDLNGDTSIDAEDLRVWVKGLEHTWSGAANLDGEFNSGDLDQVLAAGKYEVPIELDEIVLLINPTSWAEGDWNANGRFTSADLVVATAGGGYDQGLRPAVAAVPEPATPATMVVRLPTTQRKPD